MNIHFENGKKKAINEINMLFKNSNSGSAPKLVKYTFKNGATVVAETLEQAYEAIKRDYGQYIPVIKREEYHGY